MTEASVELRHRSEIVEWSGGGESLLVEAFLPAPLAAWIPEPNQNLERLQQRAADQLQHVERTIDPGLGPTYVGLEATGTPDVRAALQQPLQRQRARPVPTDDALADAVRLGLDAVCLDARALCAMHRRILGGDNRLCSAGLRRHVVWLGPGRLRTPDRAAFIPPHPRHVPGLLDDLSHFLDRTDLDPLFRATIGLGQFLSIHPFADGNGRTGRVLFQVLLRRYRLVENVAPPVGTVMNLNQRRLRKALTSGYQAGFPATWCRYALQALLAAAESCTGSQSGRRPAPNSYCAPPPADRRQPHTEATS